MDKIKPIYKKILTMKYMEDKKISDIAALLRKTNSSVMNLINRAKVALRKEMKKISADFFI